MARARLAGCAASLLVAVACGGGDPGPEIVDVLAGIAASGEVAIGVRTDNPPFSSVVEGAYQGFEIEIAGAVAACLDASPNFVPIEPRDRIPKLGQGDVDLVVATLTETVERTDEVDFSIPYFLDGDAALVPIGSPIVAVADLVARRVAIPEGAPSVAVVTSVAPGAEVVTTTGLDEAFALLESEGADAFVADVTVLVRYLDSERYRLVAEPLSRHPVAIGMPKEQPTLVAAVDACLEGLRDQEWAALYVEHLAPLTQLMPPDEVAMPPADTPPAVD